MLGKSLFLKENTASLKYDSMWAELMREGCQPTLLASFLQEKEIQRMKKKTQSIIQNPPQAMLGTLQGEGDKILPGCQ